MKKLLTLFVAMLIALTSVLAASCSCEREKGNDSTTLQVEVTNLEYTYDGTAKKPTVKVIPSDAGSLSVSIYQNGSKVSEAIDAGKYDVKIALTDTDEPFDDITKQMVISPKSLDVSNATAESKQYDKTTAYQGELSSISGVVNKDDVSVSVEGTFADSAIGENKTVSVSKTIIDGKDKGNYTIDNLKEVKASIVKRNLKISGITVDSKDVDETKTATYTGTPVLENVIEGDDVSIQINGIEFPSTVPGMHNMKVNATLSGSDKDCYTIGEDCGITGQINSDAGDFVFDSTNGIITGYTGSSESVGVPSKIDGVTVKGIGEKAFYSDKEEGGHASIDITSITLPNTLETIGESAFVNTGLKKVTIPASVKSIGNTAFYFCSDLEEVIFADGIGNITLGNGTFRNTAVKNVRLPAGLTEIPALCFQDTTGDGEFVIPATVTKLGDSAFLRSKYTSFTFETGIADLVCEKQVFAGASVTSFEIPARMVEIGGSFFQDAANLTTLTFAERTKPFTAHKITGAAAGFHLAGTKVTSLYIPGSVGEVPDGMANNVALTSLTLGEGITKINPYAFYGSSLTSVTFPKSLTEICDNAFQASAVLETITFEAGGTADLRIGAWSFQACAITTLEVPARTTAIGAAAFAGNRIATLKFEAGGTKDLVFENGVDGISKDHGYQFDLCPLTSVVLPKRTVAYTLPNVFPSTTTVTPEE